MCVDCAARQAVRRDADRHTCTRARVHPYAARARARARTLNTHGVANALHAHTADAEQSLAWHAHARPVTHGFAHTRACIHTHRHVVLRRKVPLSCHPMPSHATPWHAMPSQTFLQARTHMHTAIAQTPHMPKTVVMARCKRAKYRKAINRHPLGNRSFFKPQQIDAELFI